MPEDRIVTAFKIHGISSSCLMLMYTIQHVNGCPQAFKTIESIQCIRKVNTIAKVLKNSPDFSGGESQDPRLNPLSKSNGL